MYAISTSGAMDISLGSPFLSRLLKSLTNKEVQKQDL